MSIGFCYPVPRASKFLLRLRSHSLRSEAALKDFLWFADIPAYRVINCNNVILQAIEIFECLDLFGEGFYNGGVHCEAKDGKEADCALLP